MFEYSHPLGNCAIVHLCIDEDISQEKSREICSYIRGTTYVCPPEFDRLINDLKINEVSYAQRVCYMQSAQATMKAQTNLMQGLYVDAMEPIARKSYLPWATNFAQTPLEVMSIASANATTFGLVHVLPSLKELISKSLKDKQYSSVVVFINCFDTIPTFVDVSVQIC